MNRKKRFFLCYALAAIVLAGGVWLAVSGDSPRDPLAKWTTIGDMMQRLPGGSSQSESPSGGFCSTDSSTARVMVIDQDRSEPAAIHYGGAKIRIAPGVTMSGDVTLCGGGAEFVVQGDFTGKAVVNGAQAKLILVDDGQASSVHLDGDGTQTIHCGVKNPSLQPCSPEYFEE